MYILGLEASTSAAKAMLWKEGEGVVAVKMAEYAPEDANVTTIDADAAVSATLACGRALLEENGSPAIRAIGLSSIWHSLLLLDENSRPLTRVLTWADTSAAPTVAKYRADLQLANKLYQSSGCVIHSMYNLWKWMHLRESGDVPAETKRLSGLGEYVTYVLTGKHMVSASLASGSGFLNLKTKQYDEEILQMAGISADMLSVPVEPGEGAGLSAFAAKELGLPEGTPVCACGPDGGLNHISAGGLSGGVMTLSVGTSGALRMGANKPAVMEKPSTWCYYGGENRYIAGAATSGAGNCVKWFAKEVLLNARSYKELDALAEAAVSDADGPEAPFFLPFLFGERSSGWQDGRRGEFAALSGSHSAAHLYYAVLEGVLFNLYQNYTGLTAASGSVPTEISVSGGIVFSPFWLNMAADLFGIPLCENTHEHASLLGAVYMARKAGGAISSLCVPAGTGKIHTLNAVGTERLRARFARWNELYQAQLV
jgi:gluconokinase